MADNPDNPQPLNDPSLSQSNKAVPDIPGAIRNLSRSDQLGEHSMRTLFEKLAFLRTFANSNGAREGLNMRIDNPQDLSTIGETAYEVKAVEDKEQCERVLIYEVEGGGYSLEYVYDHTSYPRGLTYHMAFEFSTFFDNQTGRYRFLNTRSNQIDLTDPIVFIGRETPSPMWFYKDLNEEQMFRILKTTIEVLEEQPRRRELMLLLNEIKSEVLMLSDEGKLTLDRTNDNGIAIDIIEAELREAKIINEEQKVDSIRLAIDPNFPDELVSDRNSEGRSSFSVYCTSESKRNFHFAKSLNVFGRKLDVGDYCTQDNIHEIDRETHRFTEGIKDKIGNTFTTKFLRLIIRALREMRMPPESSIQEA